MSGAQITLFNRVKSQTVSTRYLAVHSKSKAFIGKPKDWDIFTLWSLSDPSRPALRPLSSLKNTSGLIPFRIDKTSNQDSRSHEAVTLRYGEPVLLHHIQSGLVSAPFIICRMADRNWVEVIRKEGKSLIPSLFLSRKENNR